MAAAKEAPKLSAAEILAKFRNKVERQISGEPDPDAPKEPQDGETFFLTTSAAVRKRKAAEAQVRATKEAKEDADRALRHSLKDAEANGRGRKRMPHELEESQRSEKRPFWAAKKPRRTRAKVTNIPAKLQWNWLKELFEKATGPIKEGRIDQDTSTAHITFAKAEDAMTLYEDFHEGEISGHAIQVELLSDSEPVLQS
eukprot:TRINITY_DN57427_c0_g1_i1.p1 TRINITY_DN57427_c0_g1~~TRINITY_DN57427_c0_g1_i1.p1  ORF type:complete len:199 (-),score=66.45 TRINITY_DN57427_c0_g1_i1:36-632(-)